MMKNVILIMTLLMLFATSCKKEVKQCGNGIKDNSETDIDCGGTCKPCVQTDVYVAGWEAKGKNGVAKYWKNGVAVNLSDGTYNTTANSIIVSNNDVYVATSSVYGAKYWKNDIPVSLTNDASGVFRGAKSIFVQGNDVYVSGSDGNNNNYTGKAAVYWKNGEKKVLKVSTFSTHASSIVVSGNDVYVAGEDGAINQNYEKPPPITIARYWKNDSVFNLTDGYRNATANSIAVSGNDVYVVGYEFSNTGWQIARFWKNGIAESLSNELTSSAESVFIKDNDVYIAGYEKSSYFQSTAKYWKNGVGVNLTDGTGYFVATSIFVIDNDVYVAGYEKVGNINIAKYWKNGEAINLTDGTNNALAQSIYVVRR